MSRYTGVSRSMGFRVARNQDVNRGRLWAYLGGRGAGKRLAAIGLGLAVLAAVLWWGGQGYGPVTGASPLESVIKVEQGLSASVEILRDGRGIPHIEGTDESDVWFALGLAHGQDRLAQMLWLRRLAQGRSAEISGEVGLAGDRLVRTLGLTQLAQSEWNRLDSATRGVLEAYAGGVNFVLESVRQGGAVPRPSADLSAELLTDDWLPVDSLTIAKLVAWETGNGIDTEIVLDELIRVLGGRWTRLLRPFGQPGQEGTSASLGEPPLLESDSQRKPADASPEPDRLSVARLWGGTAWVLAGEYTESGAPILVADYHLSPTAPALLYEARVQGGALNVAGVTIPGIPVFWAGRNLDLAWAAIPAGAVTVDLYKETVRESDGTYHDGEKWVALEERTQPIRVRIPSGWRDDLWRVRSTRHGPLLDETLDGRLARESMASEPDSPSGGPPLALSWTGTRAGNGIASLLGVAHARDADELEAALKSHHEPVLAVVYADRDGQVGVKLAGWLPRRTLPSSLVPVPGRMRIYDWRDSIPFDELPGGRLVPGDQKPGSPQPGWLAVSDGAFTQGLGRAEVEWSRRPGVRQRRLERMLTDFTSDDPDPTLGSRGPQRIDLRSAADVAWDEQDVEAAEVVPALLRLAEKGPPLRPEAQEIAQILSRWDGNLSASSRGATAYSVVMQAIFTDLFRPVLGQALLQRYLALPWVRPQSLAARVLVNADRHMASGGWTDWETVTKAVHRGLRQAWVVLNHRLGRDRNNWTWGALHGLTFRSFSTETGVFSEPAAVGVGGGDGTLASTSFGVSNDFEVDRAALYRMAVDLSGPDQMLTALAPGQSESSDDPHFSDGVERWLQGRPGVLLMSRLLVEDEGGSRLMLEPKR